jgi:N-acetylglucosamine-6-sulfatase
MGLRSGRSWLGAGRAFLACLPFSVAACSEPDSPTPPDPDPEPKRPNIVLFLVDDLRADILGASGGTIFSSPNIDRIANEGANFETSFVITSLCSPSRATVLTGLHTGEHGVRDICSVLDLARPTIAGALRASGYRTAWIGKWHLAHNADPHPDFDRWVSFIAQGSYIDPLLNIDGQWSMAPGHMTDVLTDHAVQFLQTHPLDQPYFLGISHLAVHVPYIAQERFANLYADAPVVLGPGHFDTREGKPRYLECRQWTRDPIEATREYLSVLAGVEDSMGQILAALQARGDLDHTLFVFTSDNGYFLGEHGLGDKRAPYEEGIRIPLFMRYPKWFGPGTRVSGTLALNLDVGQTILEAAELPPLAGMHGISLREQATGVAWRDRFLYVYQQDLCTTELARCTPTLRAVRTLAHKLIRLPRSTEDELYDLVSDPFELTNFDRDSSYTALRDSLRTVLASLEIEYGWQ